MTIEVFSEGAGKAPVVVGPFFPAVMVNLVRGLYPDLWTADTYFVAVVNGHADDGVTSDLAMERGGVRSLAFEVQETVLLSPSTEPEPARPICAAADAFWPPCGTDLCNRAA